MKTAKSHVANLLQVFSPKKKATPEEPERPSPTQEGTVRAAMGPDKGALFLDITGKIVSVQPRCADFFGRLPEELIRHELKDFLKPPFDKEFTNALEKGRQSVQSFPAVALRKDGSEFPTHLALKFLAGNPGFSWTVFVQAPPGYSPPQSFRNPKPALATTETATLGETPETGLTEKPAAPSATNSHPPAQSDTRRSGNTARFKRTDKPVPQLQKDYSLIQLDEDLLAEVSQSEKSAKPVQASAQPKVQPQTGESAPRAEHELQNLRIRAEENETARKLLVADLEKVRNSNKLLRKKEEELNAQVQKLQSAVEQAEARARESAPGKKAADSRKNADEPTRPGKSADTQFASRRVKELEQQLKDANASAAAAREDLDDEREANKIFRQLAEELNTQLRKLQGAAEQAEARAHESATQARDWEQKAADLKKNVDELTRGHGAAKNADAAAGKAADAQSAELIKELEQQLKDANAELDEERDATKLARQLADELNTQVRKLQDTADQAQARARESAAQSKDWETKAADLKKNVDELSRSHTTGKNVDAQSAQRIKELEQQLKNADAKVVAAAKTEAENQNSARQRMEAENRSLAETNAKVKAELEKERDAKNLSQKEKEELNAQVQKLKSAAEQTEARARESEAQSKDWEKKAADLKKNVDELTHSHAAGKNADAQSAQRIKELEQQLKDAEAKVAAAKTDAEKQNSVRHRLEAENRNLAETNAKAKAELEKERDAKKLSQQGKEEFDAQVQELKGAAEQAETRARESAAQSKDWEKKAADLKKNIDELTRNHSAEKNAAAQSAQRIKELEQQLKDANADAKTETEKLEAENRELNEANARATEDLDEERAATKLARQLADELNTQVRKLQDTADQAKARARESAAQARDWEKKAADLKKSVDELTRSHTTGKHDAKSAQRIDELEQQLDEATASLAEAKAKAKTDLEKEHDGRKFSQKERVELNAQIEELKSAVEQAEARAHESEAQSKDWEEKAADLKNSVDELTRSHTAEKNVAAQSARRVKELEQQLKDANANTAAAKTEAEKLEAENRQLNEASARVRPDLIQSTVLEKKIGELEERVREGLAKVNAELEGQRANRERGETGTLSSAAQLLKDSSGTEKLKNLIEAFILEGFTICKDGTHKNGIEKIVIYVKNGYPTHIARQLESGLWTSKAGLMEDVGQESQVERDVYGKAHTFMHRRRDGKPFLKDRFFKSH